MLADEGIEDSWAAQSEDCTMQICKCASKDLSQTTRSRKYMIIDNAFTKTKLIAKRSATV